ncbi:MAG: hypothetical protein QOJ73_1951 [Streptosporangiaceae bacterium]|jgi:hypothetical protein|nr:hypothetical protein [Streptosporangiaceae bacterium]
MNDSKVRWPRGGFEDRLEAELVTLVAQRAAVPRRRSVLRRPAWRAGLAAAGVAAVTATTLGVVALSDPASAPSTRPGPVHIRTAAFTVDSHSDGTIHVTWDKSRYFQDRAGLQQALRAAGFPVLIREGVFCRGPGDSGSLDPSGVGPGVGRVMTAEPRAGGAVTFVFTPSAMPAGEELFIGYLSPSQLAVTHGRPGSVERLVPAGARLTCTTQPPPPGADRPPSAARG